MLELSCFCINRQTIEQTIENSYEKNYDFWLENCG